MLKVLAIMLTKKGVFTVHSELALLYIEGTIYIEPQFQLHAKQITTYRLSLHPGCGAMRGHGDRAAPDSFYPTGSDLQYL